MTTWAVVGATGAVGREALAILAERGVGAHRVRAIASERSVGALVPFGTTTLRAEALGARVFAGVDVAVFAASAEVAREWAPLAVGEGAAVIDNSSAFRMEPGVPLVIPEVNGELLRSGPRLIANPNCSTILVLVALEPLRRAFGLERVHVATYQAVSGAGLAAMEELREQTAAVLAGGEPTPGVFREPCAFNVFSHDSAVDEGDGLNGEERKLVAESAKIWGRVVPLTPACVRVPVLRAHSAAVSVSLAGAATIDEARAVLSRAPGVRVLDRRAANDFPTPAKAAGGDEVLVGRLRHDPSHGPDARGRSRDLCLWLCGDQLRKGAALNAVQIGESLPRKSTIARV